MLNDAARLIRFLYGASITIIVIAKPDVADVAIAVGISMILLSGNVSEEKR